MTLTRRLPGLVLLQAALQASLLQRLRPGSAGSSGAAPRHIFHDEPLSLPGREEAPPPPRARQLRLNPAAHRPGSWGPSRSAVRAGRLTSGGQPVFPFGIYVYGLNGTEWDLLQAAGYNSHGGRAIQTPSSIFCMESH